MIDSKSAYTTKGFFSWLPKFRNLTQGSSPFFSMRHLNSLLFVDCHTHIFMILEHTLLTETLQAIHTKVLSFLVMCLVVHVRVEVFHVDVVVVWTIRNHQQVHLIFVLSLRYVEGYGVFFLVTKEVDLYFILLFNLGDNLCLHWELTQLTLFL